jgi:hypothetical protein
MKISHLIVAVVASQTTVDATLTIAAADSSTGQIGASGTSCVNASLYNAVYQSVPGHGLLMTQALPPETEPVVSPVYGLAEELLLNNTSPADVITAITDPKVDISSLDLGTIAFPGANLRQYGIVDLQGRHAGYTGANIEDLYMLIGYNYTAGESTHHVQQDAQGTYDNIVYSAQGNIVSDATVPTLSNTFETVEACDLAERLFLSLAAVFEADELTGDIRCFDSNGASGSTVFIHVDGEDGSEVIHIDNDENPSLTENPWEGFKAKYEVWRKENPCEDGGTDVPSGAQTLGASAVVLSLSLIAAFVV